MFPLFTNVRVDETIEILINEAFHNKAYHLQLERWELTILLNFAVKNQFFQLDGKLYQQVDGVDGKQLHVTN